MVPRPACITEPVEGGGGALKQLGKALLSELGSSDSELEDIPPPTPATGPKLGQF